MCYTFEKIGGFSECNLAISILGFIDYKKQPKKSWCKNWSGNGKQFDSVAYAIQKCNKNPDCKAVKDLSCDGGKSVECRSIGSETSSGTDGCTYKRGIALKKYYPSNIYSL
jgi:hypothetical protein